MFTGIIRSTGRVVAAKSTSQGMRLVVEPEHVLGLGPGESVAVNGCCLTLLPISASRMLSFDVVPESLRCTTLGSLAEGDRVNLESPVKATTLLSGHIVQGHIDGVGSAMRTSVAAGSEVVIRIIPSRDLMKFIVEKGSIAIDGVSLTVSALGDSWFEVALIPATLSQTTLASIGSAPVAVNLEVDYLIKAVVSQMARLTGGSGG